jgi:hypothetical protein
LNNETELDDPLELSLQERMNLTIKGYSNTLIFAGIIAIVIFILGAYCITFYLNNVSDMIEPVEGLHNAFYTLFGCIMLASGGFFAWLCLSGRKSYKENESINREYTHQNYLLALSVSGRESEEADLDFFNIARDVFPELKKLDIESMKKSGEEFEVEDMTVEVKDYWGRNKRDYTFDIVTDTENGKFIIKYFKKKASYDDLEQCLNAGKYQNWDKLRLVCIAENFDSDILKKYEKLAVLDPNAPLDLILVNEKGFQTLKISDKN